MVNYDIAYLDPEERITSTTGMIRRLMERFSNFVPLGDRDQMEAFTKLQGIYPNNYCKLLEWTSFGAKLAKYSPVEANHLACCQTLQSVYLAFHMEIQTQKECFHA